MPESKQIKFEFVVDERSSQNARRVIRDLIKDAEQLARTLSGVTLGGGPIPGAGGAGLVTGNVGGGGRTGGGAPGSSKPIASTGPAAQKGLAQIFVDSASSMKSMANVSKDSMRVMSEGIRQAVQEQRQAISGLDQDLAKLVRRYDELKNEKPFDKGSAKFVEGLQRDVHEEHMGLLEKRSKAAGHLSTLEEKLEQPIAPNTKRSIGGMIKGKINDIFGPEIGGMIANQVAPLASAYAVKAALGRVISETNALPTQEQAFRTGQGQMFGSQALAMKYGDLKQLAAYNTIQNDPTRKEEFEAAGAWYHNINWDMFSLPGGITRARYDQGRVQRQMEYQQNVANENPYTNDLFDQFRAQAGTRLAQMQAIGIGNGIRTVGGKPGLTGIEAERLRDRGIHAHATFVPGKEVPTMGFDDYMQYFRDRGWDGQVAGTIGSIQSGGGTRATGQGYAGYAIGGGLGGITNMAGIIGAVSGSGAEKTNAFIDKLLRGGSFGTGAGGKESVDAQAMNLLGTAASQMVMAGSGGMAGTGLMDIMSQGLGQGVGTKDDPRPHADMGDAQIARQNIAGYQNLQQGLLQGGQDQFQFGANTGFASKEFGSDMGLYAAQHIATGMTPEDMDYLRRGEISPGLADLGFTKDHIGRIKKVIGEESSSRLLRTVKGGYKQGSNISNTLDSLRTAVANGKTPQEWFETIQDKKGAVSALAENMVETGQAADRGTALGTMRTEMGLWAPGLKEGTGRWAAGGQSKEQEEVTTLAGNAKDFTKFMLTEHETIKGYIETQKVAAEALTHAYGTGADAITKYSEIVMAMSSVLRMAMEGKIKTPEDGRAAMVKAQSDASAATAKANAPKPAPTGKAMFTGRSE